MMDTTHHVRPTIAQAAAESIRSASLRQGPAYEIAFRCEWNDATQQITSATPVFRGNRTRAMYIPQQYAAGQLMLHTHPAGPIEPGDLDIACAADAAAAGVGFAICDPHAESLFLVTTPQDVAPQPTHTPSAWHAAIRRWSLSLFGRRLDLVLYPSTTLSTR